jgi:hypothetical protein
VQSWDFFSYNDIVNGVDFVSGINYLLPLHCAHHAGNSGEMTASGRRELAST